ncbi:MAG: hypothetical protein WEB19_01870 [Acidimicrobiia bacterium]
MSGEYRAVVNIDYTGQHVNAYQKILKALEDAGWYYVETSAMAMTERTSIRFCSVSRSWLDLFRREELRPP